MKYRWDNRYLHWGVTAFLVIAASMLFYYGIFHMNTLVAGIKTFLGIMAPIIYGIAIAYILSAVVNFLEKSVVYPYGIFHMNTLVAGIKTFLGIMAPIIYGIAIAYILSAVVNFLEKSVVYPLLAKAGVKLEKRGQRITRWICVISSLLFLLVVIYALVMMILPQLIRSIMNIIYSFPSYVTVVEQWLNSFIEKGWDMDADAINMLNQYSAQAQDYLTTNILPQMQSMLKNISAGIFDVVLFLKNFLIGAIVSLYVLADKERFVAKSKMFAYAIMHQYSAQAQDYLTTNILPQMQSMLKNISAGIFDVVLFLKNFLIGAIVSMYVLADKERFVAKSKMFAYAIMPEKWANTMIHAMRFTHKTFGGFISGKILDSAIIGVLCYIGVTLMSNAYGYAVCRSYQRNRGRDKCNSIFRSIFGSNPMYFADSFYRSFKESVFCFVYPCAAAIRRQYPWTENSGGFHRSFQFHGNCGNYDRRRLVRYSVCLSLCCSNSTAISLDRKFWGIPQVFPVSW